jgi:hypothetical protein
VGVGVSTGGVAMSRRVTAGGPVRPSAPSSSVFPGDGQVGSPTVAATTRASTSMLNGLLR